MPALTAFRNTDMVFVGDKHTKLQTNAQIWGGGMVAANTVGHAIAAADSATQRGVFGVAERDSAAPSSAGGKTVDLLLGVFRLNGSALAVADHGLVHYVVDDNTFQRGVGTNGIKAGVLISRESASLGLLLVSRKPALGCVVANAGGSYTAAEQGLINNLKLLINDYLV